METRPITVKRNPVPRVPFAIRLQGGVMPTDKQKAFIQALAAEVGVNVNVENIADKTAASRIIYRLKLMKDKKKQIGSGNVSDKKAAFGMATKLIFGKYCDLKKDPLNSSRFWVDVNYFFKCYQEYQERYTNN